MAGAAILFILAAMGGGWLSRELLLATLRTRHPDTFAELGQPSSRQLESLLPRYQELHLQFWKYLWGGKVFQLADPRVTALAWVARISDVALGGAVAAFLWIAAQ